LTDYTKQISYTIPEEFALDQLHLVVMVVDQNNLAVNTQHAALEETVVYE
jgi:hypothetical protein